MTRDLKILGLALAAVLAMSALGASAATAENFWFKSDASTGAKTLLDGHQKTETSDVFTADAGKVTCTAVNYTGENENTGPTGTTVKVTPAYSGCKLGTVNAVVEMDGCYYVFHTHTYTSANGEYDVTTTIACPENAAITVKVTVGGVLKCHIDIPEQTIASGVALVPTTVAGRRILDVAVEIPTGITYTQTEGTGLGKCAGVVDTTNGSYSGEEVIEGTNKGGTATDIWVSTSEESGTPFWFKSTAIAGAKTTIDGHQKTETSDVFTADAGKVTCTAVNYTGENENTGPTGTTVKVTPAYSGCKLGTVNAVVEMDGCYYVFHTHTYTSANGEYDVTTTIACPENAAITVKVTIGGVLKCHIDIPEQTIASGVALVPTTVAGRRILDVAVEIPTGITYTQTEGTGLGKCAGVVDTTNGSYSGEEVIEGTNKGGTATDIWVSTSEESGTPFWFKSDASTGAKTILDGKQAVKNGDVFTADSGALTCESVTYNGEGEGTGGTLTTVKVTPVYSGCKLGTVNAVVEMDGCSYVLHTHAFTSSNSKYDVTTTITCPENAAITVKVTVGGVLKCHIDIPEQTIATGVALVPTTVGGRRILDVTVEIGTGITYTQTEGSGLGRCAAASDTTNGSYSGEEVFEGTNEGGTATDIWVSTAE